VPNDFPGRQNFIRSTPLNRTLLLLFDGSREINASFEFISEIAQYATELFLVKQSLKDLLVTA